MNTNEIISNKTNDSLNSKAIPFIIFNEKTKEFMLTDKGKELIKQIKKPTCILSVVGSYRTGKSYFLNKVILNSEKSSNGFNIGNTINSCTKGIWAWSEFLEGKNKENKSIRVLVLDSEGFGAFDENIEHDYKIFTLSMLLSSYLIYNSVGAIDENSLENLDCVINLSNKINKMSSSNGKVILNK